jgi:hypothetical protein
VTKKQEARRAIPGRRARQVGGMLIPVKEEVPRAGILCGRCGGLTRREPGENGVRLCYKCKPHRPRVAIDGRRKPSPNRKPVKLAKLRKGKVWRLCIVNNCPLQRWPSEVGPFMCWKCRQRWQGSGQYRQGIPPESNAAHDTDRAARVGRLADLYAEVERHGAESVARAAGKPTTLEEFDSLPEVRFNDTPASAGGNGDDVEEDDAD